MRKHHEYRRIRESLPSCGRGGFQTRPGIIFAIAVFAALFACGKKEPPISAGEVHALFRSAIPASADDKMWSEAPVHPAKLILQDMVEPRLMKASTLQVNVQTITDGSKVAFLLRWDDATPNDIPGPARFTDACAVQLPAKIEADVPAPQMGEDGRPVEITYWSASWQASVNGRKDEITAIYPTASVDHYPFQAAPLKEGSPEQQAMAKRYAPARAAGNPVSGPRAVPVQDLVAEGPGTLRPAEKSVSTGSGKRTEKGWTVLIVRPLPEGFRASSNGGQVAFAIWDGAGQEVGSRKMRTAWIPFTMEAGK